METLRRRWIGLLAIIVLLLGAACANLPTQPTQGQSEIVRVIETVDQRAIVDQVLAELEVTQQDAAEADELVNTVDTPIVAVETVEEDVDAIAVDPEVPVVQTNTVGLVDVALEDRLVDLYASANPSVVLIQVGSGFESSSGSGFVFDSEGHIVTNNHVVQAQSAVVAVFADGSRRDAQVIGTDVDADLAVIKVDDLPSAALPLPLSSLDEVNVGQFVVALGSPFREQGSMSLGIVSGLGRSLTSARELEETGGRYQLPAVIQTDAPINPGNSGGPLLNLDGEVVGVNSAIRTTTGANTGVGFAVPVNAVSLIIPELIENGSYRYPLMGTSFASEDFKAQVLEQLGIEENIGAYVGGVTAGGPADEAGLRGAPSGFGGDLITQLDGRDVYSFEDLNSYLVFNKKPGEELAVTVIRDGEEIVLTIILGER